MITSVNNAQRNLPVRSTSHWLMIYHIYIYIYYDYYSYIQISYISPLRIPVTTRSIGFLATRIDPHFWLHFFLPSPDPDTLNSDPSFLEIRNQPFHATWKEGKEAQTSLSHTDLLKRIHLRKSPQHSPCWRVISRVTIHLTLIVDTLPISQK